MEKERLEHLKCREEEAERRKLEEESLAREEISRLAEQQREAEAEAKLEAEERERLERTEKARLAQLKSNQEIKIKMEEEAKRKRMEKLRWEHLTRREEEAAQQNLEEETQAHKDEIFHLAKQHREAEANAKLEEEEERQRREKAQLEQQKRYEEETKPNNEEEMKIDELVEDSRHALQQSLQSKNPGPVVVTKEYVHSIQTSELLGSGFFGTVHRGYGRVLAIEFAVKTNRVPLQLLAKEQLDHVKKSFRTELETLHAFNHPNIVPLYAYNLPPDLKSEQFLLYELADKGPLSGFLKTDFGRDRLSSFQQRVQIAVEVMTAIQFLHEGTKEIKCFHRDIKADNIVLMADMTAKVIDCGLAKFVPQTGEASATGGGKGTDEYMCPMYQRNKLDHYEAKCDVFSFGVVMAELWTGYLQNHTRSVVGCKGQKVDFYEKYIQDEDEIVVDMDDALDLSEFTEIPTYAEAFAQLSVRCMSRKLENRPSGSEVLSQLQDILAEREKETNRNADARERQEAEYPTCSSIRMQCVECRQERVTRIIPEIRAARFENRALHERSRSENRELHQRTEATLDSFSGVLSSLDAWMVNQIPALFVLLPAEHAKFRQHPRSWLKDKARTKYRIYFVCSHSLRAVRNPLKFRVSKDWVIKVTPLLACSLYALQIAGKAVTGINLDLGAAGTLVENIDTEKLSEMLESVTTLLSEHNSNHKRFENFHSRRLDHASIRRLDKESIDPIVELASSQRDWFQEMKHVRHRSSNQVRSTWVMNEYASTTLFESIV